MEIFKVNFEHMSKPSLLPNSEEVLQGAKIPNIMIFTHVMQHSFCDNNTFTEFIPLAVGSICSIKSLRILHGPCSLGDVVGSTFVMVKVAIILKPLHFSKMHMWGGEPHPT